MSDKTLIEWTDATWNPITGCSVVSSGCTNCYAMQLAGTRLKHHPSRAGLTTETKAGPVWNGEVRLNETMIGQPLSWARSRKIFVCAHGDLFHESVPDEWIDRVFAVMALAPNHTFQVLTKRPDRMRHYLSCPQRQYTIASSALREGRHLPRRHIGWSRRNWAPSSIKGVFAPAQWPLPNVWLGTSVEDQARADARVPHLLDTPAALRFVSAEPLLGPLDLTRIKHPLFAANVNALTGLWQWDGGPMKKESPRLDWVIAGGESGPDARPMHPDWARYLRDQCSVADVPFLFKQWGAWHPFGAMLADGTVNNSPAHHKILDENAVMTRIGKRRAGRLLDGFEHNEFPRVKTH